MMRDARLNPFRAGMDVVWTSKSWVRQTYHWGVVTARQGQHAVVLLAKDSPGYKDRTRDQTPEEHRKANLRLVRMERLLVDRRADWVNTTRLVEELNAQAAKVSEGIKDAAKDLKAAADWADERELRAKAEQIAEDLGA